LTCTGRSTSFANFRDRQAALPVGCFLFGRPGDFRIDEDAGLVRLLLFRQIHRHDPLGDADLDGGEPDAGRVILGLEHVLDQLADASVEALDRLGNKPQPLVREFDDLAHGHGPSATSWVSALVLCFSPVSQTYVSAIHILRAVHLFQQKAIIAAKHLPPAQQLRQLGDVVGDAPGGSHRE
jgi:hypothetical protein